MLFGGMAKKKKSKEQPETGTKPKSIEKPPATVTAPTTAPTTVPTTALVTQHPADPKPTSQVK